MTKQVINKQALLKYIRSAYTRYRNDNKESLPTFEWRESGEEAAMKLVAEHSEEVLRCASSMAGVYQRQLAKDAKNNVDTKLNLPEDTNTDNEPTLA